MPQLKLSTWFPRRAQHEGVPLRRLGTVAVGSRKRCEEGGRRRGAPGFTLGVVVTGAGGVTDSFYIELKPTAVQLHVGTRARQTSDSTLETVMRNSVSLSEPSHPWAHLAWSQHAAATAYTITRPYQSAQRSHTARSGYVCAERTQSSNDVDDTLDSSGRAAGR